MESLSKSIHSSFLPYQAVALVIVAGVDPSFADTVIVNG
jgi:hypothetical protein